MALTDNPMSLTITGNTTIGAELEVSTPSGKQTISVTLKVINSSGNAIKNARIDHV